MRSRLVLLLVVAIVALWAPSVYSFKIDPEVHQYITNESGEIWKLIPPEIKTHLTTSLTQELDSRGFQEPEDAITGAGEEDTALGTLFLLNAVHFWQPDNPNDGDYDDGLFSYSSSYVRAKNFFRTKVVPLYLKGEINESYYWLGRVTHLLEDAAVPAHVHLDPHPSGDALEDYTRNQSVFQSYRGSTYRGLQYNYEKMPNLDSFDWSTVDATTNHKQYIELFRLFWYAAQKTQYYASNDVDGNDTYVRVAGEKLNEKNN